MIEFDWKVMRQALEVALLAIGKRSMQILFMQSDLSSSGDDCLLLVGSPFDVSFDGTRVRLNRTAYLGSGAFQTDEIRSYRLPVTYQEVARDAAMEVAKHFIELVQTDPTWEQLTRSEEVMPD